MKDPTNKTICAAGLASIMTAFYVEYQSSPFAAFAVWAFCLFLVFNRMDGENDD